MPYSIPPQIAAADIDTAPLRFRWDDWTAGDDFEHDSEPMIEQLQRAGLRARIAAGIGLYEWVAWRFHTFCDDPVPLQIAEAAWCANVHRAYMRYDEFERDDWMGPVRGPLWCAITWLLPMVFFSDDRPEEWVQGTGFLAQLAFHVCPKPALLAGWVDATTTRLSTAYPAPVEDPFDDLFNERQEERRGPLVPPQAMDPQVAFQRATAVPLIDAFLRGVDHTRNPFLRSPAVMLQAGFRGTPYRLL